jgi:hypothetical protein
VDLVVTDYSDPEALCVLKGMIERYIQQQIAAFADDID